MVSSSPPSPTLPPAVDLHLTIAQFTCQLNLPAGIEDVVRVRDRLTHIAQSSMPAACAAVLTAFPGDEEAVYRIRHLQLDLWVDTQSMSDEEIARAWGQLLAKAVLHTLGQPGSQQVMQFESPRAFVSAFLSDLLDGRAWHCWYYNEFKPLQPLQVGAIALQFLLARPAWILPLLQSLDATGHRLRLLQHWDNDEVEQIWATLGFAPHPLSTPPPADTLAHLPALVALWRDVARSGAIAPVAKRHDRLQFWLAVATVYPDWAQDQAIANLIYILVELSWLLEQTADLAPLLLMETEVYPALLHQIAATSANSLGWLVPLTRSPAGRTFLKSLTTSPLPPSPSLLPSPLSLSSPIGGIFLLLPALVDSGLWERWLPDLGEERARQFLFILALKALGREKAPLWLGDRTLATFAGLSAPPLVDARLPLEPDTQPQPWTLALPEIASRWYPPTDRDLVLAQVGHLQILRDQTAAHWLVASPATVAPGSPTRPASGPEQETIAAEVAHLQLGQSLGYPWLTPSHDAALSAATSLILRRTAAKLPGFSRSSPVYLAHQFLSQPATLHATAELLTVKLGSSPLSLVLRLATFPATLAVPWLPYSVQLQLPGPG